MNPVITTADIDALARTLYGEARGEGLAGLEAVACVVMNRTRDKRWPDQVGKVCLQPYQFSCWNNLFDRTQQAILGDFSEPVFRRCYAVAAMAVADMLTDRTGDANHYLTSELFDDPERRPSWAKPGTWPRIGNHVFMRL